MKDKKLVCPFYRMSVSNKIWKSTDTCINILEFAEGQHLDKEEYIYLNSIYIKILKNLNLSLVIETRAVILWEWMGCREVQNLVQQQCKRTSGEMYTSMIILIVMIVSCVYASVQSHQIVYFKYSLLYLNFI